MGAVPWFPRCVPGLSCVFIVLLVLAALVDPSWWLQLLGWHRPSGSPSHGHQRTADQWTFPQLVLVIYTILIHCLALNFPLRLCWATRQTTVQLKQALTKCADLRGVHGIKSEVSVSLMPSESTALLNAIEVPYNEDRHAGRGVTHVILLPSYKEEIETLRESLDVLASHAAAREHYDVFLAMEEKDPSAAQVASSLINTFRKKFLNIQHAVHPTGLPGEAQGKSSNISWAARKASEKYRVNPKRTDTILTVVDADTHLSPNYFILVSNLHIEDSETSSTSLYVPPIIFDRNAYKVPALVRMADLLWCGASLSGIYPGSKICIPTSVYSVPLPLADQVNGWDTGPEAIGEDLHMYLKCYFATGGQLNVKPIYSPASQCNVCSDLHGIRGWTDSLRARWRQAMRHMWGSLDSGYGLKRGWEVWSSKIPPSRRSAAAGQQDDFWHLSPLDHKLAFLPPLNTEFKTKKRTTHFFLVYHRLFEAHFLPTHLTLLLLSSAIYSFLTPPVITPFLLSFAFDLTAYIRALSFCTMLVFLALYERYHDAALSAREAEMRRAGLYDEEGFSIRAPGTWREWWTSRYWADYVAFPVAGMVFGSIPAMCAQWGHFWTDHLIYQVSAKPMSRVLKAGVAMSMGRRAAKKLVGESDIQEEAGADGWGFDFDEEDLM